ncbi:MAG: aminomethyl-transferring glycine dehydrogenase [Bacteroidales bacterium]|nr:aminomethyl-transferring glycine dehydrogenase [Bacteroidales bacterium]
MHNNFIKRHIGPTDAEQQSMLKAIGFQNLDDLIDKTFPADIRLKSPLRLPKPMNEFEYINHLKEIAAKNKIHKSYIGMGYYETIMPAVIQRNILENPGWYTSYTPYQAEISQGRLEALLNFQTVIMELTGMEVANASLLDEATAAAEAMQMMYNSRSKEVKQREANRLIIDKNLFPQTISVIETRANPLGIEVVVQDINELVINDRIFGIVLQYPNQLGEVYDYSKFVKSAHEKEILVAVVADIMGLVLLQPPGTWGADVVVGSTQRFGIPMGYGGPHAAYFATCDKFKRSMPGRIIGVSVDRYGKRALRMALQTREQHIKREKATSNICTSQALLANMAGMYALYHGKDGLQEIANRIHQYASITAERIERLGYKQLNKNFFDTIRIQLPEYLSAVDVEKIALDKFINFRYINQATVGISINETTTVDDINEIIEVFAIAVRKKFDKVEEPVENFTLDHLFLRNDSYFNAPVFSLYRSETEMMRYIKMLENKDISLTHSMISLGSCTMKLNAAVEMLALSWIEFSNIHPFVPIDQVEGFQQLIFELGNYLKEITGFAQISFQPNSGAAGEYAGLMVIRRYYENKGESHRNITLIPRSAHGTNPASAVMAGMNVVVVDCDEKGNIDIEDLRKKAEENKDNLAAFMVTYPSTHGVFEDRIIEMNKIVHENGGQVYMDGANMNAQVGLTKPALIGADVCHLNLHKTFGIPHGGGGPGMGPICVAEHLVEFLPAHPLAPTGGVKGVGAVASAPWGSASILTISYAYCRLLGGEGLTQATRIAILNANYIAARLKNKYNVLYTGKNVTVAHEMILDCRDFKRTANITETDIAKRLIDYGFHAPTLSFPVHGTLMVEPTESESLQELDRFIYALSSIYDEIKEIEEGKSNKEDNVLINAPHTANIVCGDQWHHSYNRVKAGYPAPWLQDNKYWPPVSRIDDAYGDRNLVCSCLPISEYEKK